MVLWPQYWVMLIGGAFDARIHCCMFGWASTQSARAVGPGLGCTLTASSIGGSGLREECTLGHLGGPSPPRRPAILSTDKRFPRGFLHWMRVLPGPLSPDSLFIPRPNESQRPNSASASSSTTLVMTLS